MLLLPPPVNHTSRPVLDSLQKFFGPRSFRKKYLFFALLFCLFSFFTLIYAGSIAESAITTLISPLTSSLQTIYSLTHKTTDEAFSFAPGHAPNKFSKVDFDGLNILAFFDVLIDPTEGLLRDSRGYRSFRSDEAAELFETAHFNKTKVLLTLTLGSKDAGEFLNNSETQDILINQLTEEIDATGIDGIAVNLEGSSYQSEFTKFIANLSDSLHSHRSDLVVAVVVPSNMEQVFNLEELSKSSDKILLVASSFAVPEVSNNQPKNPVFGFSENEYWSGVSEALNSFSKKISPQKLVLERAWYGNGNRYPLYVPNDTPPVEEEKEPAHVFMDSETIERLVSRIPAKARDAARKNIPLIAKALEEEGILDSNVLAYALATIEHETAETFEPLEEYSGRLSARRLGYEGGSNYFGRGFIQLTHLRNYKAIGKRIGMGDELVKHPELAATPEISAKILAAFFKDNNIANLASRGNFIAARAPVNPDRNGYLVASLAWKYEPEI